MIEIDGSFGEGGGAILRTTLALSAVTKKPCHIFNIRKGRPKPGLRHQHLLGLRALAELCNGRLEGDFLNSEEIKFWPGEISSKNLRVKIETAGSIVLVLQTLILPSFFAAPSTGSRQVSPIKISFDGGATDTFFSPTIDHFRYVFLEILKEIGGKVELNILKRGYYPEGGAKVEVKIYPFGWAHSDTPSPRTRTGSVRDKLRRGLRYSDALKPLNLIERGSLKKITIISGASEFLKEKKVAERQLAGVREVLGKLKLPIEEKSEYYNTQCPGSQICLIAGFKNTIIGVDNLGKLGKRAENVGKEAALNLLKEEKSGACLDRHLADQILPYLALAKGKSEISVSEITNHCKANIWVIEKFTQHRNEISGAGFIEGRFEISGNLISWGPV